MGSAAPLALPWGNTGIQAPAQEPDDYPDVPHLGTVIEVLWRVEHDGNEATAAICVEREKEKPDLGASQPTETRPDASQHPGMRPREDVAVNGSSPVSSAGRPGGEDELDEDSNNDTDDDAELVYWRATVMPSTEQHADTDQRRLRYEAREGFPEEEVEVIFGQNRTLIHKTQDEADVLQWRYQNEVSLGMVRVVAQGPDALISAQDLQAAGRRAERQNKRTLEEMDTEAIYSSVDALPGLDAYGKRILAEQAQAKIRAFMSQLAENVEKAANASGSTIVGESTVIQALRLMDSDIANRAADAVERRSKRARELP